MWRFFLRGSSNRVLVGGSGPESGEVAVLWVCGVVVLWQGLGDSRTGAARGFQRRLVEKTELMPKLALQSAYAPPQQVV